REQPRPALRSRPRPQYRLDQDDRRRRRARPGGNGAGADRDRFPDRTPRPAAILSPLSRDRRPQAHRTGLHRTDDRRRGAFPHVSPDDRALVDRFLDMMAAEFGASKHTLAAYRNDLERASETVRALGSASTNEVARLGEQWRDVAPSTVARRSAALRRFFGFLV